MKHQVLKIHRDVGGKSGLQISIHFVTRKIEVKFPSSKSFFIFLINAFLCVIDFHLNTFLRTFLFKAVFLSHIFLRDFISLLMHFFCLACPFTNEWEESDKNTRNALATAIERQNELTNDL